MFHGYVSLPKGTQDNPFKIDEVVGLGDNLYSYFFGGYIGPFSANCVAFFLQQVKLPKPGCQVRLNLSLIKRRSVWETWRFCDPNQLATLGYITLSRE